MNIASITPGFQPIPYMAVYSATKAFVQTFSEADPRGAARDGSVGRRSSAGARCPPSGPRSPTPSGCASPTPQVSPQDVAEAAIGGMLAGKRSVVPGVVPKVVSTGGRYVPRTLLLPAIRIGNRFRGGPSR